MPRHVAFDSLSPAGAVIVLLAAVLPATAEEYRADFRDGRFDKRVLKTTGPAKYLEPSDDGLHITIPDEPDAENSGVQFPMHLVGDCTLQATIEIVEIPQPDSGYGTGVALLLEDGIDHGASLQRIRTTEGGEVYIAHNFVIDAQGEYQHEGQAFPAGSPHAILRMKREKKSLIYEVSEDNGKSYQELRRIDFSDRPLRAVQVYGQTGGEPNAVTVVLKDLQVSADSMVRTGQTPTETREIVWWQVVALIMIVIVAVVGIRWAWHRWER